MKLTKFFAVAFTAVAMVTSMTSCGGESSNEPTPLDKYDPTQDEKNILLDLPSFAKTVEGLSIDQVTEEITKRGYSLIAVDGGELTYAINVNNLNDTTLLENIEDPFEALSMFATSKTTLLTVQTTGTSVVGMTIVYFLPQDSAAIKYTTIHQNLYSFCQDNYELLYSKEESEFTRGFAWNVVAAIQNQPVTFTNRLDQYQYMYDNNMITKEHLDLYKASLEAEGDLLYENYVSKIPEIQYAQESIACFNGLEEVYFDYTYINNEEILQQAGLSDFPEGLMFVSGSYSKE